MQPTPKLRGIIHAVMAPLTLVIGLILIVINENFKSRTSLAIITLSAVSLFSGSALYHRVGWTPKYKSLWRRIDHVNITILIAGSYTPFALYILPHNQTVILLSLIWSGAIIISLLRIFWLGAPRWLYIVGYILLASASILYLPYFLRNGGIVVFLLIVIGGLFYTSGAIIYGLKKPNLNKKWFGFHELFHSFTAIAFTMQFLAAILVVNNL